jgi:hypothetical protein
VQFCDAQAHRRLPHHASPALRSEQRTRHRSTHFIACVRTQEQLGPLQRSSARLHAAAQTAGLRKQGHGQHRRWLRRSGGTRRAHGCTAAARQRQRRAEAATGCKAQS